MGTTGRLGGILTGLVLVLMVGLSGTASAQQADTIDVLCLVDGGCDDDQNPDVQCGGDALEGDTSCSQNFSSHDVEKVWILYCGDGDDCDNDGDEDPTTGEVVLQAWDDDERSNLDIWFEQTYSNGADLDATNDVNDSDCGLWWHDDDYVSLLDGRIHSGDGTCDQEDTAGWWNVGLDWESD